MTSTQQPARPDSSPRPVPLRVLSIDILRGATVALMILINDPGDWQQVYAPLDHAEWNGYTPADLVFPNFLFLAGASLVFSLQTRIRTRSAPRGEIVRGLLKRALNLIVLKLFVAAAPTFRLRRIRIFGVLFRSALLGLAGGLTLLVSMSIPVLLGFSAVLLTGYWLALRLPFGSLNQPLLDPDNNVAAWLDRKVAHLLHGELHTGALYNVTHDPEGLLSSVPALATVLHGMVAALVMRSPRYTPERKAAGMACVGAAAVGAGHLWHRSFPINKNLWTSSYVLVSTGWSLLALSALYWLYDIRRVDRLPVVKALTTPLRIFGANALPAYIVSQLGHKTARTIHVKSGGHSLSLRTLAYRKGFARRESTPLRSLAFAVCYAGLCFLPNLLLWRKKVFVKI